MVTDGVAVLDGDEAVVGIVDGIGVVDTVGVNDEEDVGVGGGEGDGVRSACCFKQSSFESDVSNTHSPEAVSHNCVMQSVDTVHGPHSGLKQISSEASDPSVHFEL